MASRARPDTFTVYLHHLDARPIEWCVIEDGRHITRDVALYVRPEADDVAAVTAGLRQLAESAAQMADALDRVPARGAA